MCSPVCQLLRGASCLLALTLPICNPLRAQKRPLVQPSIWADKPTLGDFIKLEDSKLAAADSAIATLSEVRGPRTIENTLELYDKAVMAIDETWGLAFLVQDAHPDPIFRHKGNEYKSRAESAEKALALNRGVYAALAGIDLSNTDSATKYYVERRLQLFRLAGVDRNDSVRARLRLLQDRLSQLESKFLEIINEDQRTIAVEPCELDGLPQDYIESHQPGSDGLVRITTTDPDYVPIMKFAVSDGLRLRLYKAKYSSGYPQNRDVAQQMLHVRFEIARLLGYASWADYNAVSTMTRNAKTIEEFIATIGKADHSVAEREFPRLLEEKRKLDPTATDISSHELLFLTERVRRQSFAVDSAAVRAYLPVAAVKQGLWEVASKFFHVEFVREAESVAWHPSVETWDVLDNRSMIGRIYLDLYARDGKAPGWESFLLRDGKVGEQLPETVVIINLAAPNPQNPGLMEQEDLDGLFHEFGHAMARILSGSRARWAGTSRGNIEPDFPEVPSQFLEKLPELPSVLPTFARHYKTNSPIPADLVNRLRLAATVGRGMTAASFNALSAVAFFAHERSPDRVDLDVLYAEQNKRYNLLRPVPDTHYWASWPHISDYSSRFYMYDWDAVIVEDFWSQFDREKPLASEPSLRYRRTVLEPGGSESANTLVKTFLGRPQNLDAYRHWLEEGLR